MISFIVIGKNEGWKLTKCFESIYHSIEINQWKLYEIIYIDSNSIDDSIEKAISFDEIKVFKLTKICNPAIARNLGAQFSNGDVLVFIDGDMEVNPLFFKKAVIENKLVNNIVAGTVVDRIINSEGHILSEIEYHKKENPYFKLITGGAFIIEKTLWDSVGGMDNRFVKSADPELGLRLAKKGYLQYCIPEVFVFHNNDKYESGNRLKISGLLKGYILYSSVLMYRKTLFAKHTIHKILLNEKSLITFFISLILFIVTEQYLSFLLFIFALIIRSAKYKNLRVLFERFIYFFLRDIITFFSFFLFFPKKIHLKNIPFKRIK